MPPTAKELKPAAIPAVPEKVVLVAYEPIQRDPLSGALKVSGRTILGRVVEVTFERPIAVQLVHDCANVLTTDPELRAEKVTPVARPRPIQIYPRGVRTQVAPRHTEDEIEAVFREFVIDGTPLARLADRLSYSQPTFHAKIVERWTRDYRNRALRARVAGPEAIDALIASNTRRRRQIPPA